MVDTSAPVPSTVQSLTLVVLSAVLCACIVAAVNFYFDPQDRFGRNQLERKVSDLGARWADEIPFGLVDVREFKKRLALDRTANAKTIAIGSSRMAELGSAVQNGRQGRVLNLFVDAATVKDYQEILDSVLRSGASLEGKAIILGVHAEFFQSTLLSEAGYREKWRIENENSSPELAKVQYLANLKVFWTSLKAAFALNFELPYLHSRTATLTLNASNGSGTFNPRYFPEFVRERIENVVRYLERKHKSGQTLGHAKGNQNDEELRRIVRQLRSRGAYVVLFAYPMRVDVAEYYRTKVPAAMTRLSRFGEDMAVLGAERAGQWPGEKALCSDAEFFDEGHFNSNCLQRSLAHRIR